LKLSPKRIYQILGISFLAGLVVLYQNFTGTETDADTIGLRYTYNLEDDTTEILDLVNSSHRRRFDYDGLSRMILADYPNAASQLPAGAPANLGGTISYNKLGDITSYTEFGKAPRTLNYSSTNRRLTTSAGPEARTYTYNTYGQMTSNGVHKYGYATTTERLISVSTMADVKIVDYTYDANNQRVKKVEASSGRTTYYVYSGQRLMYEGSIGGGLGPESKEYFYSNNYLISTRTIKGCVTPCAPTVTYEYMHFDPVRSTIAVSKADGSLVRERYNAYGSPMQTAATGTENVVFNNLTDVRFSGHVTDDETGLVYMGARYYAPTLGRFITMDPAPYSTANVQSFNRYAYANNNPNKFIDPDGESPVLAVHTLAPKADWVMPSLAAARINSANSNLSPASLKSLNSLYFSGGGTEANFFNNCTVIAKQNTLSGAAYPTSLGANLESGYSLNAGKILTATHIFSPSFSTPQAAAQWAVDRYPIGTEFKLHMQGQGGSHVVNGFVNAEISSDPGFNSLLQKFPTVRDFQRSALSVNSWDSFAENYSTFGAHVPATIPMLSGPSTR